MPSRSSLFGKSTKKIASHLSARKYSGGSLDISLLVAITYTSL